MVQTFSDENNVYSVDMMFAYINIFKPKPIKVNVRDYLDTLEFEGWGDPKKNIYFSAKYVIDNPNKYPDEYERIKKANLKYPIIIANNYIVDGVHRLSKAYMQNKKQINAYIFDKVLIKKFLIDRNKNWNKIDKFSIHDFIELFYRRFKCAK